MQAIIVRRYGGPDQLQVEDIPRPACGAKQVLIQVQAAGVNPIDWRIRSGSLRFLLPARFPLVLGFDVAGQIAEVGRGVNSSDWQVGDRVFAFLDNRHGGGYAEYAVASAAVIARMPTGLTAIQAASVPLAALTALQALRDQAHLAAGQRLLVNGASGGVGTFAVQLGKTMGASVIGACSPDNHAYVRDLGADEVIDYHQHDFTAERGAYHVIFDAAAKSSYVRCRRALTRHGCYVTTVPTVSSTAMHLLTRGGGRRCRQLLARPRGSDLEWIGQLLDKGTIRPEVQQVYAMPDAPAAHRTSEAGHVRGKLVIALH